MLIYENYSFDILEQAMFYNYQKLSKSTFCILTFAELYLDYWDRKHYYCLTSQDACIEISICNETKSFSDVRITNTVEEKDSVIIKYNKDMLNSLSFKKIKRDSYLVAKRYGYTCHDIVF